jgi:hypothetical protein
MPLAAWIGLQLLILGDAESELLYRISEAGSEAEYLALRSLWLDIHAEINRLSEM